MHESRKSSSIQKLSSGRKLTLFVIFGVLIVISWLFFHQFPHFGIDPNLESKTKQPCNPDNMGKPRNRGPSAPNPIDLLVMDPKSRIDEFYSTSIGTARQFELFRELGMHPLVSLSDALKMANSFGGQQKSIALSLISERCAKEDPIIYFQILDSLAPGHLRTEAIGYGTLTVAPENMKQLIAYVECDGEEDELEALHRGIKVRQLSTQQDLEAFYALAQTKCNRATTNAILYSIGASASAFDSNQPIDSNFRLQLDGLGDSFQEGKLRTLAENCDPRFFNELNSSTIQGALRYDIIRDWASSTAMDETIESALDHAKILNDSDLEIFCSQIGQTALELDSLQASKEIAKLPPSRQKNTLVAQMVDYLQRVGDRESAEQWKSLLPLGTPKER